MRFVPFRLSRRLSALPVPHVVLALLLSTALGACGGDSNDSQLVDGGDGTVDQQPPSTVPEDDVDDDVVCTTSGGAADPADACEDELIPDAGVLATIGTALDAYASGTSVAQGESIRFHLSDHSGAADTDRTAAVEIFRIGTRNERVYNGTASMRKQAIPNRAWENCCDWPVGLDLEVPADWRPGYYKAEFASPDGGMAFVDFIVRSRFAGNEATIALHVPTDTGQAFNNWGGKSLLDFNSTDSERASSVSLFRPSLRAQSVDHYRGIRPFIQWAESQGYELGYLSSEDLHSRSELLGAYRVLLLVGQDQYWTQPMRNALDDFSAEGGHIAVFGGGTMWRRTARRIDLAQRANGRLATTSSASTGGDKWFEFDPVGRSLLSSFLMGASLTGLTLADDDPRPRTPYVVQRADHWVFAGTGLANGDSFGGEQMIHQFESDGIDYRISALGLPVPTGGDTAPLDTVILATADLAGWRATIRDSADNLPNVSIQGERAPLAAMTAHTRANGATTVNLGTSDYFQALVRCTGATAGQTDACRIARNVLDRLTNQ